MLRTVAHLVNSYLFLTGSWIYHQINHAEEFNSVVFANRTENLHLFPWANLFAYSDIPFHRMLWYRLRSASYEQSCFRYWCKAAIRNNVDLLHCHLGPMGVKGMRLQQELGVPLITSFYGADMSRKSITQGKFRDTYPILFQSGDLFLVEGPFAKRTLIDLGCPKSKIVVQHLGVDVSAIRFCQRRLDNTKNIRFLMAASLVEKKGVEYAIKAYSIIKDRHKNTEFKIIGDGPLRLETEALIRRLNLSGSVRILGYLPYNSYLQQFRVCDIFLAPSVTAADGDTEGGAPVCIIEAQASGMPVIATYHADIPEVVQDGETGFLVVERDVEGLAEKMDMLIHKHDLWPELGRKGREHIETEFNINYQVKKLTEIYSEILSRS